MKALEALFLGVVLVCLVVVALPAMGNPGKFASAMKYLETGKTAQSGPPVSGDSVQGGPSLSGDYINKVLSNAGSPAAGTGQSLYDLSAQYGIDDAYALAVFDHESSYGKYGAAFENRSLGNIICAGYPTCNGRFRCYSSWADGYADFYRLIRDEYIHRGLSTVEAITPVYAPASENDPSGYISSVLSTMATYRRGNAA